MVLKDGKDNRCKAKTRGEQDGRKQEKGAGDPQLGSGVPDLCGVHR